MRIGWFGRYRTRWGGRTGNVVIRGGGICGWGIVVAAARVVWVCDEKFSCPLCSYVLGHEDVEVGVDGEGRMVPLSLAAMDCFWLRGVRVGALGLVALLGMCRVWAQGSGGLEAAFGGLV